MATIGDAPLNGVYTLGSYASNYPIVFDMTYPISSRDGLGALVLHEIEIGSVMVAGSDIFVSWHDRTADTYGIDNIDADNKLDGAFMESILLTFYRQHFSTYTSFNVAYVDKPVDTDVEINYSTDYGVTYVPTAEIDDAVRRIVTAEEGVEGSTMFVKVIMRTSANSAPTIDEIIIFAY